MSASGSISREERIAACSIWSRSLTVSQWCKLNAPRVHALMESRFDLHNENIYKAFNQLANETGFSQAAGSSDIFLKRLEFDSLMEIEKFLLGKEKTS